ncbi:SOS response-associated peptidase family protein [Acetanaerobacterium elongatum]|uniref:SOS response-associated peptidase family protein n=1 Tax=Acetanaerobacterium elongatum TaxID=258515 RepID=UPI000B836D3C
MYNTLDGFFEWSLDFAKKKGKYLFNAPDSSMLYTTGLYNPMPREELPQYMILTTADHDSMRRFMTVCR